MHIVLVRGTGDIGSAVAHVLRSAGHTVLLHDTPCPSHPRRGMAFVDALYEGTTALEGVLAKRARSLTELQYMAQCGRAVPVTDTEFQEIVERMRPDIVVDARMRKPATPEPQRGLARLTIGLGPNFEAGKNVDAAIETDWGQELGAVLWSGRTRDLAGEPQQIAGHARDRYVYAPLEGVFATPLNVGRMVKQGQETARIGEMPLYAPLRGCLRGLTHHGAWVARGTKVIEVDPRGAAQAAYGLGERARAIAEGVLKAVRSAA